MAHDLRLMLRCRRDKARQLSLGSGHVELGEELDVALHAAHLNLHIVIPLLPVVDLPLELLDPHACFIPARGRALPIALASLLLTPFGELILRHG